MDTVIWLIFFFARETWWFLTPMLLLPFVKDLWLYSRFGMWASHQQHMMLEIKPPPDVLRTPKAMEMVFAGLHGMWNVIKWQDKWFRGEFYHPRLSLELVGNDGAMHFYIRLPKKYRNFVEAHIYAQYPEAEVFEVEDYIDKVPPDIPNQKWEAWGTEMELDKKESYPIRTYEHFEDIDEERRLDPLSAFAELFSKLKENQWIWIQTIIMPVMAKEGDWVAKGKEEIDIVLGRKKEAKPAKGIHEEIASMTEKGLGILLKGEQPTWDTEAEESELGAAFKLFRMSFHETEIVKGISNKISKPGFKCMMRILSIAPRDVYDSTLVGAVQGAFRQMTDQNLNGLKLKGETKPSSHIFFLRKMRNFRRNIRQVRLYRGRMYNFLYGSSPYVLNSEELATLFHFPGKVVHAPSMGRVESRKGVPPSSLPTG